MDMKIFLLLATLIVANSICEGKAALRRKPKVYNALITTDEDLIQSRAYPVIQPTIHESGIAHYPYGPFNPYGFYNPHVVKLSQPVAPALTQREQIPYPLPSPLFPPQLMQQPLVPQPTPLQGYPLPQNPSTSHETKKSQEALPSSTNLKEQPPTMTMQEAPAELPTDPNKPSEQLPIPLNQYGLPPSLIPIKQSFNQHSPPNEPPPFHLPPYSFNQFHPLYYNSLPGLKQQFLPPYDYLPTVPQFPLSNAIPTDKTYPHPSIQPLPLAPVATPTTPTLTERPNEISLPSTNPTEITTSFENIKNGSKSKDINVPDVPPPPIPLGPKPKQS